MSLLPIRVEGSIQCQTAQQLEQHAFAYTNSTASGTAPTEAAHLDVLLDLLTCARNDSNRFLTALIAKYPKAAADKGGRRKKRVEDEDEDDEAAEDEQQQRDDKGPQLDALTAHVTVPLPTDPPVPAPTTASSEPETKRPKLEHQ